MCNKCKNYYIVLNENGNFNDGFCPARHLPAFHTASDLFAGRWVNGSEGKLRIRLLLLRQIQLIPVYSRSA